MKVLPEEVSTYEAWVKTYWESVPEFSEPEKDQINQFIQKLRHQALNNSLQHHLLQALPLIVLLICWLMLMLVLPRHIHPVALGLLHGLWGYSFIIFTLHEGAGHELLAKTSLRPLVFHLSRLMFADPAWYREVHGSHHRFLGTNQDQTFTQFVFLWRVLLSLVPGAGVLFPINYKVHQGPNLSGSLLISFVVGISFLGLECWLLSAHMPWWQALLSLTVLGTWIGFSLDRLRESIEHWGMPNRRQYGTRELGLGWLGLLLGGGPWGQPCHFSHHFAPDLSWYQQLRLHFFLKKIAPVSMGIYGLNQPLKLSQILKRLSSKSLPKFKSIS